MPHKMHLLNDMADLHLSSLGTLVIEVICYMFYATRPQVKFTVCLT